jgi:hypothetical protein
MSNTRAALNFKAAGSGLSVAIADNPSLGPAGATDITYTSLALPPSFIAEWAGPLPTVTGPGLELLLPTVNGAPMTFDVKAIYSRLSVLPVGSTAFRVEKSAGGGAFSASTIATLTHTTSDYEKSNTALTGTLTSGDLLRIYFATMAGSGGTYLVQLLGMQH